ncbi:MAG TPA: hypothetical protein PK566_05385 [Pseudobacteroides sp.]|nr:hypothetical protein [Pseudobacteroides sp.]
MKPLRSTNILIFFISIIICLPLAGCGNKNNEPIGQQQSAQNEQNEKVPQQLIGIEQNIEGIITALDGPSVPKENDGFENKDATNDDKEKISPSDDPGSKNNEEDEKKGSESSEGSSSESPSPSGSTPTPNKDDTGDKSKSREKSQDDPWEKISSLVNSLHYQWNELMPDVSSKGAPRELTDNFSNSLNSLTNIIITKSKENTLMASNKLYSYIPDMLYLYKSKTSPELKRVRYYTRDAVLNSLKPDWAVADADIISLKSSWLTYRNTADKKLNEEISKLDYSINELEKVIKDKNQPLIDIKGRVVLSNINFLEENS